MNSKIIEIGCKGADTLDYRIITEYQGNLKELSKENYERLRNSIINHKFAEPITVWNDNGVIKCGNGHQRLRAIKNMVEKEGYTCPPIPVNWVYPKDENDFARIVLSLASQFGEVTNDGLYEYMNEHKIDMDYITENFRLPEIDLQKFIDSYINEQPKDYDGSKELNSSDFETFNHICPRCKFEFNDPIQS